MELFRIGLSGKDSSQPRVAIEHLDADSVTKELNSKSYFILMN